MNGYQTYRGFTFGKSFGHDGKNEKYYVYNSILESLQKNRLRYRLDIGGVRCLCNDFSFYDMIFDDGPIEHPNKAYYYTEQFAKETIDAYLNLHPQGEQKNMQKIDEYMVYTNLGDTRYYYQSKDSLTTDINKAMIFNNQAEAFDASRKIYGFYKRVNRITTLELV